MQLLPFHKNVHSGKSLSDTFQIKRNMIVVNVFYAIMKKREIRLVYDEKEDSHYDHIILKLKQGRI